MKIYLAADIELVEDFTETEDIIAERRRLELLRNETGAVRPAGQKRHQKWSDHSTTEVAINLLWRGSVWVGLEVAGGGRVVV